MSIKRLYKYGQRNKYSETLFSTPQIWFSPPSELNDPFECRPWLMFEGTPTQIIEALARALRKKNPLLTQDAATAEAAAIFKGQHYDSRTWKESIRQDLIRQLGGEIGLYCLSRVPDSILMWSHYVYNHRGYCLVFEAADHTSVFSEAQPVLYSDDFPIVDVYNTPREKQVDLVFLTKYIGWAYEQEWRIIDLKSGPGLHEYPAELLKGVVFGLRMSEAGKAQIRKWVSRRGHPVQFYQAVQDDRKFTIEIQEAV